MISILIPTRGRFSILKKSLKSIIETSDNLSNFELLLGMDLDDLDTLFETKEFIKNFPNFKIITFDRLFYHNFHKYMNTLATYSKGELLWLLADDVEVYSKHWDTILINKFCKKPFMYGMVLTDKFEHWRFSVIPLINRKWINITDRISNNSQTDLWLGHIAEDLNIVTKISEIQTRLILPSNGAQHNSTKFYSTDRNEWLQDKEKIRLSILSDKDCKS